VSDSSLTQSQRRALELEKLQALEYELLTQARNKFKAFVYATYPEYQCNWHHNVVMEHLQDFANKKFQNLIICMPPQHGKLIEDGMPVLTTRGWKRHGELKRGDYVFHASGMPTQIIATSKKQLCNASIRIEGRTIFTHMNHLWKVAVRNPKNGTFYQEVCNTKKVQSMLAAGKEVRVPHAQSTPTYHAIKSPIDPYVYGLYLTSKPVENKFTVDIPEARQVEILEKLESLQVKTKKLATIKQNKEDVSVFELPEYIQYGWLDPQWKSPRRILWPFDVTGVEDKCELIAGIIDGLDVQSNARGEYTISADNSQWHTIKDLASLLYSIGCYVSYMGKFNAVNGKVCVMFYPKYHIPCAKQSIQASTESLGLGDWAIVEEVQLDEGCRISGQCIQVEHPDGLYLIGTEHYVTHNSELVSRKFPAFVLGRNPDTKIIAVSFGMDLTKGFNRDVQRAMMSPEYRRIFPNTRINPKGVGARDGDEVNSALLFEVIGRRGSAQFATLGSGISGKPCDLGILDDLYKDRADAESETTRRNVWDWYTDAYHARTHNQTQTLITMTRWHEDDIVGRLVREQPDKWKVLVLPRIREEGYGYEDDPREVGEVLWPQRHNLERALEVRKLSERNFSSLQQQRPAPAEGNIIKKSWWRFYEGELPEGCSLYASWDLTFSDGKDSDFVVGQVWAKKGPKRYLVDMVRGRWDFIRTLQEIKRLRHKYPGIVGTLVENKANGAATIATLKREFPGIIAITPTKSKKDRLEAVAPLIESGCVYLPNPVKESWVNSFMDEISMFPSGKNDDMVDTCSQYLDYSQRNQLDWNISIESFEKTKSA